MIRKLLCISSSITILLLAVWSCSSEKIVTQTKIVKETIYITKNEKSIVKSNLKQFKVSEQFYPADSQNDRVRFVVIHYTSLDYPKSVKVLTKQAVSSHYLITDSPNDTIDILVSEDRRAWHAGISYWGGTTNLNDSSIGVEIVNEGYEDKKGQMIFYPYPEHQFKKVGSLVQDIVTRYKIPAINVVGHSDIAPQRKQDPGAEFPWERLYKEYRVGTWYLPQDVEYYMNLYPSDSIVNTPDFIYSFQKELNKYGYEIQSTGTWDKQTLKVIQAFQMHYRPKNYSGIIDRETWAILAALNKRYRTKK